MSGADERDGIERTDEASGGAYRVEVDGHMAEMTFSRAGEHMIIIDHTEVDDVLRGTGTGRQLVAAAVEWARGADRRLLPLCPFARSVFDRVPEYRDVLAD